MVFLSHPPSSNHSGHQCVLSPSSVGGLGLIHNGAVSVLFPAAFHVATVSRWTASLAANAKSGTRDRFTSVFIKSVDALVSSSSSSSSSPRALICISIHWNVNSEDQVPSRLAPVLICVLILFPQPPGGIPGSQPLLPNSLDPTRPQGETGAARVCGLSPSGLVRWCGGGSAVISASDYGDSEG